VLRICDYLREFVFGRVYQSIPVIFETKLNVRPGAFEVCCGRELIMLRRLGVATIAANIWCRANLVKAPSRC
jgi:hypothetical protein